MNRFALLLLASTVALGACTDTRDALMGTASLRVELITPTETGDVNTRLPDTAHTVSIDLQAIDEQGEPDSSFTGDVRVYAQFLGTLTPDLPDMPLSTIHVTDGHSDDQMITLPDTVLGPATLWIDNGTGLGPDYQHGSVTGTSPTLWFRDPFIADLQRPRDETGIDALSAEPLQNKQVNVHTSRYGSKGRLVVTSVFAQGYTVDDVQCANDQGAPPCTAQPYDHALVFTFSAPNVNGELLKIGQLIDRFTGGLSEFNGLTEIGFPRTYAPETPEVDPARLPAPVQFSTDWFKPLSDPNGRINFERNEAGAIAITNAFVCPLDDEYTTYKQWKIDPGGTGSNCNGNNVLNLITAGSDFTTDPATLVGKVLPRVVGIVRPVSIASFNVWIVFPRGAMDLTIE